MLVQASIPGQSIVRNRRYYFLAKYRRYFVKQEVNLAIPLPLDLLAKYLSNPFSLSPTRISQ